MTQHPETLVSVEGLSKSFGDVHALRDVDLTFRRGEVLALVGENGAGKSTLMRLLEGVFPPSSGTIRVEGREVRFSGPRSAHEAGIRVIHQEPEIVPNMSVGENIFIGDLPRRFGLLSRRKLTEKTRRILVEFGMERELHAEAKCAGLGPAQRQMIEIMRAVHAGGKLVAFDEPTSSLTDEEARRLFQIIRRLRAEGVAVIYISHRLPEVMELSDRVAILRDGQMVGVVETPETSEHQITSMMVGRELSEMFPDAASVPGRVILEVQGLTTEAVRDVSLVVRQGEVVGIGGLMGAGRSELAKGIFGFDRRLSGEVRVGGAGLPSGNTAAAIAAGIGFAPEDRKEEALLLLQSIMDNTVLCIPEQVSLRGFFHRRKARRISDDLKRRLSVKALSIDTPVANLSGGNQQKVVLARWLARDLKVLILDEPTRGIDVGAKAEIYDLIRGLTRQGLGVIVISSEMPELLGLSDRILVMADGEIRAEFDRKEATEEAMLEAAMPRMSAPAADRHMATAPTGS